jgi:hypothetical protein
LLCCLAYELTIYRENHKKLPPAGTKLKTGKGVLTVTRTEIYQDAVWLRDDEGGEHRVAYAELPPGPYHTCGDCNCGAKKTKNGNGDAPPESTGEPPPDAWADPPDAPAQ